MKCLNDILFQLLFSNFTLTENMLENKKEMEKLLKFDNITKNFVVGKALRASNKGMVVKALQKSVDMQNVESNVSNFLDNNVSDTTLQIFTP